VLLDMDGTLVDAFKPIAVALNTILEEQGLPTMSLLQIRRHTGSGDGSLAPLFGDQWPAAHQRFLEIHDVLFLKYITPLPGSVRLLRWLTEHRIPAAIVTNKSQVRAEAQVARLGWNAMLRAVVGVEDGRPGKPDPAGVLEACRRLQVEGRRSLFIGDGTADMQAASRAGCTPVGLSTSFSATELENEGASYCFASLPEAHAWLSQQIA